MSVVARVVGRFADAVLRADLPELPEDRLADTIAFVVRRVRGMPSPMRLGVGTVAATVGAVGAVVGDRRVAAVLRRFALPLTGEYVRLVRSLAYAYVWERWPSTSAAGAAR
jgi:hypothetical protein